MLDEIGMEAFAERARRELRATGETARKRAVTAGVELTAQEAQIARLAADGLSNPEIGTRLFLSPRTVQYHLGKVFTKLDITSRAQLSRALSGSLRHQPPSGSRLATCAGQFADSSAGPPRTTMAPSARACSPASFRQERNSPMTDVQDKTETAQEQADEALRAVRRRVQLAAPGPGPALAVRARPGLRGRHVPRP